MSQPGEGRFGGTGSGTHILACSVSICWGRMISELSQGEDSGRLWDGVSLGDGEEKVSTPQRKRWRPAKAGCVISLAPLSPWRG